MQLTVLGSGSRGNALLVESAGAALLVDAGFSFRDLQRRLALAGRDVDRITAIALTHEHGDHARGVARATRELRVPVAASPGTLAALRLAAGAGRIPLAAARATDVGPFRVTAFPTAHDASQPVMLVVEDGEGRRLGVAYDVGVATAAVRHALRGLDALVLESNHDDVLLRASSYPASVRSRIAGPAGHLSNRQAGELLAACAHRGLSQVVLAHLSERCNRADLAHAAAAAALAGTAFRGALHVATQDTPTPTLTVGGSGQLSLPLRGR